MQRSIFKHLNPNLKGLKSWGRLELVPEEYESDFSVLFKIKPRHRDSQGSYII